MRHNYQQYRKYNISRFLSLVALLLLAFFFYKNISRNNEQVSKETTIGALPSNVGTNYAYIHPMDWPPKITKEKKVFSCIESNNRQTGFRTSIQEIQGRDFCIDSISEGAAGSKFTTYTYKFQDGTNLVNMKFVIRAVQCDNFDNPKKSDCQKEQIIFDPYNLVKDIINSGNY